MFGVEAALCATSSVEDDSPLHPAVNAIKAAAATTGVSRVFNFVMSSSLRSHSANRDWVVLDGFELGDPSAGSRHCVPTAAVSLGCSKRHVLVLAIGIFRMLVSPLAVFCEDVLRRVRELPQKLLPVFVLQFGVAK